MKYAVISDVHGNYPALKAVLEDAGKQGISDYLFAGDYCLSGPWPNECIDEIKSIPSKHIIRGNEERYLENLIGTDQSLWTDGQMQISYWSYRNVRRENLDYILGLPHRTDLECNGVKIHMSHHSTDFIGEYPFSKWNSPDLARRLSDTGRPAESVLAEIDKERESDPAFLQAVSALEEGVYVFGHSHLQWSYASKDKSVYLINPGSCGLPLDAIRDSVPYSVLEISDDGEVSVEQRRVAFDMADYIRKIKETSQYREANAWTKVIFRELATATEHIDFFLSFTEQYAVEKGDGRRPFALDTWEEAFELWDKLQHDKSPILAYRMEYKNPVSERSAVDLIPYSSEFQDRYKVLYNTCYHGMREALGIRPFDFIQDDSFFRSGMENVYLLTDGDEIIGGVALKGEEIDDLIVDPKYQGRGYGKQILLWALENIKTKNIFLRVADWNKKAISLYEKCGFEITGHA